MVSNERQSAQLASTLAWLEDNIRDSKTQVGRLGLQVEQAQTQLWEATHRLHRAEEVATALAAQLGVVPRLAEEVSSVNDKVVRAEDRQTALESRMVEIARQQALDADRTRAELNELVKRIEGGERLTHTWAGRFDTLEEAGRRSQEATAVVQARVEDFERFVDLVDQRGARNADAVKRVDSEFARLSGETDALQKQDAALAERFGVYQEVLHRFEDELAVVAQQADVRREISEKFDLQRANNRRADERLTALEKAAMEQDDRVEGHGRSLSLIDSKDKALRDRLTELLEDLGQYRLHVAEQFQRAQTLVERQKRRQIEDLEREIREIKVHGYRPPEESS
ncbi:MAG: hypothetical protein ACYDCQ_00820 [Dehalococcoidia bacterium]